MIITVVPTDDTFVAPLEDADDAAFDPPVVFQPFDAGDDAVAVHRFVQMRAGDVDVSARLERPFRRHEAVAGRMRLQPADEEVHLFRETEAMAADLNEIARSEQRFDMSLEGRPLVARDLQDLQELADPRRVMDSLAHQREHLVA